MPRAWRPAWWGRASGCCCRSPDAASPRASAPAPRPAAGARQRHADSRVFNTARDQPSSLLPLCWFSPCEFVTAPVAAATEPELPQTARPAMRDRSALQLGLQRAASFRAELPFEEQIVSIFDTRRTATKRCVNPRRLQMHRIIPPIAGYFAGFDAVGAVVRPNRYAAELFLRVAHRWPHPRASAILAIRRGASSAFRRP